MEYNDNIDHLFKLVVLGESGVGKTNIILRYSKNKFDPNSTSTVGVDFSLSFLNIDGKNIKLQFWDTAGQERLKSLASNYYNNANGAILVYDISDRQSFEKIAYWKNEILTHSSPDIKIILLGNKCDLLEEREVSLAEGQDFARKENFFFMEVSAKQEKDNVVKDAVTELVREILEGEVQRNEEQEQMNRKKSLLREEGLAKKMKKRNEKKGCC